MREEGGVIHKLTDRELSIAKLLGQGYTQAEIADKLGISARAVKANVDRIRLKLGVERSRYIPRVLRELGVIDGDK